MLLMYHYTYGAYDCVRESVLIHSHTYNNTRARTQACMHACSNWGHTNTHKHVHTYTRTRIPVHSLTHTYRYTHTHTYACPYTYTNSYTNTHAHTCARTHQTARTLGTLGTQIKHGHDNSILNFGTLHSRLRHMKSEKKYTCTYHCILN